MKEYVGRKEFNDLELELDLLEAELLKSLKQTTPYMDGLTRTYELIDNRSFRGIL